MEMNALVVTILTGIAAWIATQITKALRHFTWADGLAVPINWAVSLLLAVIGWKFVAPVDPTFPQALTPWLAWGGTAALAGSSSIDAMRRLKKDDSIGKPINGTGEPPL